MDERCGVELPPYHCLREVAKQLPAVGTAVTEPRDRWNFLRTLCERLAQFLQLRLNLLKP